MMVATRLRRLIGPVTDPADSQRIRSDDKILLWVRLLPPAATNGGTLEGAVLLMLPGAEAPTDAGDVGDRVRLEVTVPAAVDDAGFASVRQQLAWLTNRGVDVEVSRAQRPATQPRHLTLARTDDITLHVCSATVAARLSGSGQM